MEILADTFLSLFLFSFSFYFFVDYKTKQTLNSTNYSSITLVKSL